MYCELGGDVCGEIGYLGHEKEVVCIVSGEGEYVRRSVRLGHGKEAVCIVSGGGRGRKSSMWEDRCRVGSGEEGCMYLWVI